MLTQLIYWLLLCVLLTSTFVAVVLIRITVPRFKLETLSKLGWRVSLSFLGVFFIVWFVSWLLF